MDYLNLFRTHGVSLQFGGSDQWGNITAGCELIRRVEGGRSDVRAHALTTNLLTKADGSKLGKTEGGAIWLDAGLTSPYAFYQFWLNTDDRDVIGYLKSLTFLTRDQVEALEIATAERPAVREAQRTLARELTTLVHGAAQTEAVESASRALFGRGEIADLDPPTLEAALAEVSVAEVAAPVPSVVDLLVATGLAPSRGAARRIVDEGGAYVNNAKISEPEHVPAATDLLHGEWLVVRRGKRNIAGVRVKA
jgi:tyrosyl-tRNA synthetase